MKPANPYNGEVDFKLLGKVRRGVLVHDTVRLIEQRLPASSWQGIVHRAYVGELRLDEAIAIIWACLLQADRTGTLDPDELWQEVDGIVWRSGVIGVVPQIRDLLLVYSMGADRYQDAAKAVGEGGDGGETLTSESIGSEP